MKRRNFLCDVNSKDGENIVLLPNTKVSYFKTIYIGVNPVRLVGDAHLEYTGTGTAIMIGGVAVEPW